MLCTVPWLKTQLCCHHADVLLGKTSNTHVNKENMCHVIISDMEEK